MAEPAPKPDPRSEGKTDVRYLPVPASRAELEAPAPRPIERAGPAPPPAAAAAAAGGFLAGVATFVLARVLSRREGRRALARALTPGRRRRGVDIVGSRSFLVDVHVLRR